MDPLSKLAYKYGTDKCPKIRHTYTPFYFELLKDRKHSIRKVLELGIGSFKGMKNSKFTYDKHLGRKYYKGASLYMWRDFFPKAKIYGADNNPDSIFKNDRIKTYLCDETKKEDLLNLIKNTGSDIDLFIDDGSHHVKDQIFTCQTLMPFFKKDIIYVIEDARRSRIIAKTFYKQYECIVPPIANQTGNNQLVIIRNINI